MSNQFSYKSKDVLKSLKNETRENKGNSSLEKNTIFLNTDNEEDDKKSVFHMNTLNDSTNELKSKSELSSDSMINNLTKQKL